MRVGKRERGREKKRIYYSGAVTKGTQDTDRWTDRRNMGCSSSGALTGR